MKIAFITSIVYPSQTANRIHILSMVKAFASKDINVSLLCKKISAVELPSNVTKHEIGTSRSMTSAWKYVTFLKRNHHDAWFIREPHLMLLTIIFYILRNLRFPPYLIYEIHDLPRDFFDELSISLLIRLNKYKVIAITNLLKKDIIQSSHLPKEKIIVLPDGVDIETFSPNIQTSSFLGITLPNKPVILYTGSLFAWKGVYVLAEVAKQNPGLTFWFVGGYEDDVNSLKRFVGSCNNVKIFGHVPHEQINQFLILADVLVLPNSASLRMSERYTSPLKLFEYMTSGRPIVASYLPSIQEILTDGVNAYLVEPDNVEALTNGIFKALNDPNRGVITARARRDVLKYTWETRVDKILECIEK